MELHIRVRAIWITVIISIILHILFSWFMAEKFKQIDLAQQQAAKEAMLNNQFQIIDLVQTPNKIVPKKSRFMGVESNSTNEETVAVKRKPAAPTANSQASQKTPKSTKSRIEEIQEKMDSLQEAQKSALPAPNKKTSAQHRAPSTAIAKSSTGQELFSLPEDYFPDYKHGGHTYVNVMRHPSVGYFVELKRALKIAWNPMSAIHNGGYGILRSKGKISVVVGVAVDDKGNLAELFVLRSSGAPAYDREALRTFQATFPFFPPSAKALAISGKPDKMIRMSWDFQVYM